MNNLEKKFYCANGILTVKSSVPDQDEFWDCDYDDCIKINLTFFNYEAEEGEPDESEMTLYFDTEEKLRSFISILCQGLSSPFIHDIGLLANCE